MPDTHRESLFPVLREKAGDGTTDYFVEVLQSDLAALLDLAAVAHEAALVRSVARRGMGYGWRTFDALAQKAGLRV